jgi:hypothetical protein
MGPGAPAPALKTHLGPVLFGSQREMMAGVMRALASSASAPPLRAAQIARRLPRAIGGNERHLASLCEVAHMLADRLGLPASVRALFAQLTERWDGKGHPGRARRDEIPLALRIAHVARDAAFQQMVGGDELAARVVRDRAGRAFDPAIAALLADHAAEILAPEEDASAWEQTLACEPSPRLTLEAAAIDRALAAMGAFADLASPYLVGHSAGVAELATAAAQRCHLERADVLAIRRAALVHDVGRVAIPVRIWQTPTTRPPSHGRTALRSRLCRRPRHSPRKPRPGDSTPTPLPRCSRRAATAPRPSSGPRA